MNLLGPCWKERENLLTAGVLIRTVSSSQYSGGRRRYQDSCARESSKLEKRFEIDGAGIWSKAQRQGEGLLAPPDPSESPPPSAAPE